MVGRSAYEAFGSPPKATFRLACYLLFTLLVVPVRLAVLLLPFHFCGERAFTRLVRFYHRGCCFITGVEIEFKGKVDLKRPTLFVANHVSYLDIMVLGSCFNASFVAKSEVGRWPFFGFLARLCNTVFVDRRRSKSREGRDMILKRLTKGRSLILFPEGTSSDGTRVLPFRSSFFAAADGFEKVKKDHSRKKKQKDDDQALLVQPISITYARLDGMPLERCFRPFYAWYGEMELVGHLWHALSMGVLTVKVECHEPVLFSEFGNRKDLASHCQKQVAFGVSDAMAHRRDDGFEFAASGHDLSPLGTVRLGLG